jgi:uncharacterized protein with HEPN domain
MRPDERDAGFLWDMLEYAKIVQDATAPLKYHQYQQNRMLQLAVERAVEVIGEAARHVSAEFRQAHPEIPWRKIIGQRHFLAHEYGEIKQEKLWLAATVSIPELIALLEPLIPPLPPEVED